MIIDFILTFFRVISSPQYLFDSNELENCIVISGYHSTPIYNVPFLDRGSNSELNQEYTSQSFVNCKKRGEFNDIKLREDQHIDSTNDSQNYWFPILEFEFNTGC